jgi:hypothetical protein
MDIFIQPKKRLRIRPCVKNFAVLLFLCFAAVAAYAQRPLSNSRQSSYYTYFYKLTPEDVLAFYKYPDKKLNDKILYNRVDSVKTDSYWENTLPAGNYIKASA